MSRLSPQKRRLLDQASLGAVKRQKLRLVLCNLAELSFDSFGDASVKRTSQLPQQSAIGRVLYKCVLKQIGLVRRNALSKEQTGSKETV